MKNSILILSLITTLFVPKLSISQIHISGALSGVLEDTTYIVDGDIWVDVGDSLVIEAGANLLFRGNFAFDINGYLNASGTIDDSITFTSMTLINHWLGIKFNDTASDSNRMEFCLISESDSGGIYCNFASPYIYKCTIEHNTAFFGAGIYLNNSNASIVECFIQNNSTPNMINYSGGGILCNQSSAKIMSCNISNNRSMLSGGIYLYLCNDVFISNCIITNNRSYNHGGGLGLYVNSNTLIENCIIKTNFCDWDGGGIFSHIDNNTTVIRDCEISYNSGGRGGGIFCYQTPLEIENCTISENSGWGGGICSYDNFQLSIINTILAYNYGWAGIVFNNSQNALISYCNFFGNEISNLFGTGPDSVGILVSTNINGDSCDYFHNIFLNPIFVDTVNGNFQLYSNSPCIDAGDPNSPLDPDSTIADIGAYYFYQSPSIDDLTISIEGNDIQLQWFPIPIATIYHIYRSTEPYFDVSGMTPIASVVDTSYIDINALNENGYFYRVIYEY